MAKIRPGYKYFTSSDLATIKRNTNYNNHLENYLFIAKKIGYPTLQIKRLIEKADRGHLGAMESYDEYQNLMRDLGNKVGQHEYQAVYSRL